MLKRGREMNSRAQITIFIIIGIVIVVGGVLIYLFWPKISSTFFQPSDPRTYLQDCISPVMGKNVKTIEEHGGSFNPAPSYMYGGVNLSYLCYTNEYYKNCIMQKPLLKREIETELEDSIKSKVDSCFDELKKDYEGKGYQVLIDKKDFSVELFPKSVVTKINYKMVLSNSQGTTQNENFVVNSKSDIYDLVSIAGSIANYEARYGDSETVLYMSYYPQLKVDKMKRGDGTKVYTLEERNSGEKFIFASRSVVFPPGYNG